MSGYFWSLKRRALTSGQLGFRAMWRGRPVGLLAAAQLWLFLVPQAPGADIRQLGFRATGRGRPVGLLAAFAALVIFGPSSAGR